MDFDIQKTTTLYTSINTKLGAIAPLFWQVFAVFVANGTSTPSAIEKSFQVVQTLPQDSHGKVFERYLGLKVAA